jgi:hypothetical protein
MRRIPNVNYFHPISRHPVSCALFPALARAPAVGRAQTLLVWHRERSRHVARETFSALLREMLGREGVELPAAELLSV